MEDELARIEAKNATISAELNNRTLNNQDESAIRKLKDRIAHQDRELEASKEEAQYYVNGLRFTV